VSGPHNIGAPEVVTGVEGEAIREQEEGVEGMVRGVVGRRTTRRGVQNGGV